MKLGTVIKVKGRGIATVVYHQLDGYGVIWGKHKVDPDNLPEPEAMLRREDIINRHDYEWVGTDYEIVKPERDE